MSPILVTITRTRCTMGVSIVCVIVCVVFLIVAPTAEAFLPAGRLPHGRCFRVASMSADKTLTTTFLRPQQTDTDEVRATAIWSSVFFLGFAAMLGKLVFVIQDSSLPITVGTSSLLFVSAAVAYDNLIIGLGDILFPDARTNGKQYSMLKWLSYPRFVLHASGVPFLFTTVAEIGKYARVEWLDNIWIQNGIVGVALVVALVSRVEFFQSPGIEIKDTSDSPPNALERQLLWFTYKEPEFLYVLPSILLALWSLIVGASAFSLEGDAHAAGVLLIVSAIGVLAGNAQKSFVARFTGNFAEVIMLWCMFVAASYVM